MAADKVVRVELVGGTDQFRKSFADAAKASGDLSKSLGSINKQIEGTFQGLASSLGPAGGALAALGPAGLVAAAGIGAAGAAFGGLVAFLVSATKGLAEVAGGLSDLSLKTGLTTTTLQELKFAGMLVGVSMEEAGNAVGKMQKAIVAGDTVFARLGLNLAKLRELSVADQFDAVAAAIKAIKDPTQQAAAAMEAFGKGGASILPLIKSDMAAAREEAHRLGLVIGEDDVAAADALGDSADKLSAAWDGFKNQVGAAVVESGLLQSALGTLLSATGNLATTIKENRGLFRALFEGAEGAATTAAGLMQAVARKALNFASVLGGPLVTMALSRFAENAVTSFAETIRQIKAGQKAIDDLRAGMAAGGAIGGPMDPKGKTFVGQGEVDKAGAARKKAADELAAAQKKALEAQLALWKQEVEAINDVAKAALEEEKRVSAAAVLIFGSSKQSAEEAAIQFGALGEALSSLGKNIYDLSESDLTRLEAQLVKLEIASRGNVAVNGALATVLGQVRAQLRKLDGTKGFEGIKAPVEAVVAKTADWEKQLENIAHIIASFPGGLGKVGGALAGLTAGGAGIGAGLKSFKDAGALGGLTGLLGKIGAAGQIASAAIGIGQAIVGLFKSDPVKKAQEEAGRALSYGISRELAQTLLDEAKRTGQSIAAVAKQYAAKVKAGQEQGNLDQLRAGVDVARQGAETLLGLMDKLSPKAQAAGQALIKAVADAMAANGLGVLATGELAKSEKFSAVQQAVGAAGQITTGLRQAGGIDSAFLQNGGAFADAMREEATAAALEAGLSSAEAQKAGLQAISPLLRDQLNASIESGVALSAQTQQLIDEAKANGINIVADPLLEQLAVQKSMDASLKTIAGKGTPSHAAGVVGVPRTGLALLHRGESVIPANFSMPSMSSLPLGGGSSSLLGGRRSGARTSVSAPVNISINGSGLSPEQITHAVTAAVRRRDSKLIYELRRLG